MFAIIFFTLLHANPFDLKYKNGDHFFTVHFQQDKFGVQMRHYIQHSWITQVYNREFKKNKALKNIECMNKEFKIFLSALRRGLRVTQKHPNNLYNEDVIEKVKKSYGLLRDEFVSLF
jgi:hypothetical protein